MVPRKNGGKSTYPMGLFVTNSKIRYLLATVTQYLVRNITKTCSVEDLKKKNNGEY